MWQVRGSSWSAAGRWTETVCKQCVVVCGEISRLRSASGGHANVKGANENTGVNLSLTLSLFLSLHLLHDRSPSHIDWLVLSGGCCQNPADSFAFVPSFPTEEIVWCYPHSQMGHRLMSSRWSHDGTRHYGSRKEKKEIWQKENNIAFQFAWVVNACITCRVQLVPVRKHKFD